MNNLCIIDNHILFCEGLAILFIHKNCDFKISGIYTSMDDFLNNLSSVSSDVLLIDHFVMNNMYDRNIIDEIKSSGIIKKIVFLSDLNNSSDIIKYYDSNVDGFISKSVSYDVLIDGLNQIVRGNRFFSPDILPLINKELLIRDSHEELINKLTKREKQILIRVANGMSNIEIAIDCHISERTVKNHLSSIFQKIHVSDRTQAAVFAIKTGLVQI